MQTAGSIRYLPHSTIDKKKWDNCIRQADNALIYAFSFYLDAMCPGWAALVLGNYELVMPLTFRRKYGIRYLFQPAFTQQLGLFGKSHMVHRYTEAFLQQAGRHFSFGEIYLNYCNAGEPKANFVLSLNSAYETIAADYGGMAINNLGRAARFGFSYQDAHPAEAIRLFQALHSHKVDGAKPGDYPRFESLCQVLDKQGMLVVRKAVLDDKTASLILLANDGKRLYLLLSATSEPFRKQQVNYFLIDGLIREFAGSPLKLDFEGSDIPGIARFFESFGAVNEPYYFFRYNHLPWPLRLLKK